MHMCSSDETSVCVCVCVCVYALYYTTRHGTARHCTALQCMGTRAADDIKHPVHVLCHVCLNCVPGRTCKEGDQR